jgi:ATP phosphoribosyltransferase regulatory subunit
MPLIPDGTRYSLPPEWEWRESLRETLENLFHAWGYEAVHTPALEVHDSGHPLSEKSFKLIDRDGTVLALRSEFTTAISHLVRGSFPNGPWPLRLRYSGNLWIRTRDAEIGRSREYSQVGFELLGVSTAKADAEVVTLALEGLRAVGLENAAVELRHPGFVRSILEAASLEETKLEAETLELLRHAIDRKDAPGLRALLEPLDLNKSTREAVTALIDLYGGPEVLLEARKFALNDAAKEALDRLEQVVAELELAGLPADRFLFDLGLPRRYDYYTGVAFQAYTPDFGQPLVGGGRYDGANQPGTTAIPAAGLAFGLERIMTALGGPPAIQAPDAIALDAKTAREMRAKGWRVEHAWTGDRHELESYARARGIKHLLQDGQIEMLEPDAQTPNVQPKVQA